MSTVSTVVVEAHTLVVDGDTEYSPGVMVVSSGKVVWVGPADKAPKTERGTTETISGDIVVPGFVDIHNHGYGGTDEVQSYWTVPEFTLQEVVKFGTTSMLASLTFPTSATEHVSV